MKHIVLYLVLVFVFISCESDDNEILAGTGTSIPDEEENNSSTNGKITLIEDTIDGLKVIIAGSKSDQFIISFYRKINDETLIFINTEKALPVIMEDTEGNSWDIFGFATNGPRLGFRLQPTNSLMGYWFSFGTFFPGIKIWPSHEAGDFKGQEIVGSGDWLVPPNEVRSGGVGKDGIPALSNLNFDKVPDVRFLSSDDLVVGFRSGNNIKAFPHDVLDWHEIANDKVGDLNVSVVYCPLTGTATIWNRKINNKVTTFGVSGFLYNSNIVPYDRETDSFWSQLFDVAIKGVLIGVAPEKFMSIETSWQTWQKLYPNSDVLNFDTGFSRNYGVYPYNNYKTADFLIFPVKYEDKRMPAKERVHVIYINRDAKAYRFKSF